MVFKLNEEINKKLFNTPLKSVTKTGIFNRHSKKILSNNQLKKKFHDNDSFKSINTFNSTEIISLENEFDVFKNSLDRIINKEKNLTKSIEEWSSILDNYEKELNIA